MVGPFSWLWWLNAEPLFIAFLTGEMFWPRIFLKMDLDFNDRKVDQSFGKRITAFLNQFSLPFLNANVLNSGVSHFEKWDV